MKRSLIFLALLLLPLSASEFRSWRNSKGDKSIAGRFVQRDEFNLTILRRDRRELILPLTKIHADDVRWLNEHHPLPPPPPPKPVGTIADLQFGDTRKVVTAKLQKSPIFEATVAETFFGRTGLNGVFHTKKSIGGYQCLLFFNWHDEGGLKEITLQTTPEKISAWDQKLKPAFTELIQLISSLHGKPVISNDMIQLAQLENGSMSANYLWNMEPAGSILLGPAKEDDQVLVAVRFTEQTYQPKESNPAR